MERFNRNIRAMQTTLYQRPEVFQTVRVYAAINISDSVVNDLMCVLWRKAVVSAVFIGEESGACFHILFHDLIESMTVTVFDYLSPNLAATFQDAYCNSLMVFAALRKDSANPHALVHVPSLTTDERLIGFDFTTSTTESYQGIILQSQANSFQHEPFRLFFT